MRGPIVVDVEPRTIVVRIDHVQTHRRFRAAFTISEDMTVIAPTPVAAPHMKSRLFTIVAISWSDEPSQSQAILTEMAIALALSNLFEC